MEKYDCFNTLDEAVKHRSKLDDQVVVYNEAQYLLLTSCEYDESDFVDNQVVCMLFPNDITEVFHS